MSTRFGIRSRYNKGVPGLPSGYDGLKGSEFTIPPCGIVDVDRALFNLFNEEIPAQVSTAEGVKKVPVIFGSPEKWAAIKKNKGLRDDNGSLILPLLTIVKTDIVQSFDKDIAGRGSNQHTGELKIKRRLSPRDRGYQSLLNKLFLKNQSGVAVQSGDDPVTDRQVGSLTEDPTIMDGGFLESNLGNNIFEIITIPTPQFLTMKYEVTIWTQYQQQMNEVIECLISSYMPQLRGWKIETPKGYWFLANVTSDDFASDENIEDMVKQERIIKRKFSIEVPSFVLATDTPGAPVPIKKYISNPVVTFGITVSESESGEAIGDSVVEEPFLGADDPTLPLATRSRRKDMRDTRSSRYFPNDRGVSPDDPALTTKRRGSKNSKWKRFVLQDSSGNRVEKFVRVKSYNPHTGEMVLDGQDFDLGGLTIVSVDD